MHVSLDSALGRQRRLNSVGESVLQIAPSAAAAYSLRSLTGADPKVVRVRRGSDNHEQDFTASEVSSGALTSFVNAQVIAPLDIQALTATGRDGDFLIAKAAYSLRSLGTRQATLAATGDTVARADGKFVVQVRRSSDDALKSFTADEVTDGTLLAFVKTEVTTYTSDFSTDTDGWSAGNGSAAVSGGALELTPNTVSTTHHVTESGLVGAGEKVRVSFDVKIPSGQSLVNGFKFVEVSGTTIKQVNNQAQGDFVSYSEEFTSTSTGTLRFFANNDGNITFAGDDSEKIIIKNIVVTNIDENGFVKTWYDQSVDQAGTTATGNHATQATAAEQPKIVNAGSLLADGLTFDGSDDFLGTTSAISSTNIAIACVSKSADNTLDGILSMLDASNDGHEILYLADKIRFATNNDDLEVSATITNQNLYFANYDGSTQTLSVNGTASTQSSSRTISVSAVSQIGSRLGGNFLNGSIEELIIYASDQTANRTAIEGNLGETYSIDLPSGVDPGFDQVDGFVETWYDQSGNGRDSINTTAAQQPIIVDAGVFQDGLKFTHTDTTNGKRLFVPRTAAELGEDFALIWVGKVTESDTSYNNLIGGTRGTQNYATGTAGISIRSSDGTIAFINEESTTSRIISSSSTTTTLNEDSVAFATHESAEAGPSLDLSVDGNHQNFSVSGYTLTSTKDIGIMNSTAGNGTYRTQESPTGVCREVLVYDTNQNANRVALETNINNQYNLF